MNKEKICTVCNNKYIPLRATEACSKKCRRILKTPKRKCVVCQKIFQPSNKNTKCCSRQCIGKKSQSKESKEKRKQTSLKKYGVENPSQSQEIKNKAKQTNLEKYGVEYSLQSSKVRNKAKQTNLEKYGAENVFASEYGKQKIKETNIKKYGVEHPRQSQEIKDKTKLTNLKKYGVEHHLQSQVILQKLQETNLEKYGHICSLHNNQVQEKTINTLTKKYGVDSPFKSQEIQEKIKQTNLERYGVTNPFSSTIIQDKIKQTNLQKYDSENYSNSATKYKILDNKNQLIIKLYNEGKNEYEIAEIVKQEYITIRRVLLKNGLTDALNISSLNKYWQHKILKEIGVTFDFEGKIFENKRLSVDLFNEEYKIAIDINPTITHSTQPTPFYTEMRKPKSVNYHRNRAEYAEKNGWFLIQIFDWDKGEDIIKLLNSLINSNKTIFARKCKVKEIANKEANEFLNINHRQMSKVNSSIQLGLFYNDKLVQVMTFSKVRFTRNNAQNSYELLRLASINGFTIVGGASKLFSSFIKKYNPIEIKTYVDYSKSQGNVYEKLGMEYIGYAGMNALYANIYTSEAYKVTYITNKFKKEYKELGLTQQEFMNNKDFYRINDAGNKIYIWKANK